MRDTITFEIDGKMVAAQKFKKGDRVKLKEGETMVKNAVGTVEKVECFGFLVHVNWDKDEYESMMGGCVILGNCWMAHHLDLVT